MAIETLAATGSTNDDLLARAAAGAPEGLWLRAERQTGGKGRQGRIWLSPAGNLYASTLVRVRSSDPPAPTLALVSAVALHEVASGYASVQIKWPNDLLNIPAKAAAQHGGGTSLQQAPGNIESAKLGGILLERSADAIVIGMGVNLAHHPIGLDRPVTSIAALTGTAPDPSLFLLLLAERFAAWLARWRSEGVAPIRTAWLAAAHPIGTALSTGDGDGLFDGLDESGALRLRLSSGERRLIHAGDVFLL